MATCPRCQTRYDDTTGTRACPSDGATLLPDGVFAESEGVLPAGHAVGEYIVEHLLGVGGFGAVYKAVQPLIGKYVALKILNRQCSANPQVVSRFVAEARAVNQIQHRNIIDIFGFGQIPDGRHFYVMELLNGEPLDVWLAGRGRITLDEALPILRPLARALDAAHAKGIAHRDLKPENIFLVREAGEPGDPGGDADHKPFPKLLDFGIAKLLSAEALEGADHRTHTGTPIGTPAYMSPEQCRGRGVDHRTDVYSFGVIVYRMLTGHLPFTGLGFMEIAFKQMSEAPPRPSSFGPLPEGLDERILWFLAKDPAHRPATLAAGIRALEDLNAPFEHVSVAPLQPTREMAPVQNHRPPVDFETGPTLAPTAPPTTTPSFVGESAMPSPAPPVEIGRAVPWPWLVAGVLALAGGLGGILYLTGPPAPSAPRAAAPSPPVPEPVTMAPLPPTTAAPLPPATQPPTTQPPAQAVSIAAPIPATAPPPPQSAPASKTPGSGKKKPGKDDIEQF